MSGAGGDAPLAFGALLRRRRERAGLSQEELAERAGVSAQAVGALERGARRRPHPATARRLADALGLDGPERAAFLAPGAAPAPPAGAASAPAGPTFPTLPPLPAPLTPLLGRDAEVARATALLRGGARLVTLTGPGGVGKTRLALAVAACAGADPPFADGAAFVPLAPLADAALVLPAVAHALGLGEAGDQPPDALLRQALRDRSLLLVLDNCEHVVAAAAEVAALLAACPRLAVLATSRAPLRVRGEHQYPVAPLALPVFARPVTLAEASRSPAVRLFVERARAASPAFALTAANASAVAAICGRLDGLPLALELAAPRVKLLPPAALLGQLHRALPLLTGGGADAPDRQRTLRATIAWSYDLLDAAERALFRRLAVFAGGFDLDAAAAVAEVRNEKAEVRYSSPPADFSLLDLLGSLVDKSLLRAVGGGEDGGEPRFGMLETIREYALDRLVESGEAEAARARHLDSFVALAERAAPELVGPDQAAWLDRLEREQANFRAALGWARERGEVAGGLRLAGALARFWRARGYGAEGLGWLTGFLATPDGGAPGGDAAGALPVAVRARALHGAGTLANWLGEQREATRWLEQAVALYRAAGDPVGVAAALDSLAGVDYDRGELTAAMTRYEECVALARAADAPGEVARALGNLGEIYYVRGELERAAACYEEALATARQAGHADLEAIQLGNLGNVARLQRDLARARALQREALARRRALGDRRLIAANLEDLAALAAAEGRPARAARLLGASAALRAAIGAPPSVPERLATERAVAGARAALGEAAWAAAVAAGRTLPLDEAIDSALEEADAGPPAPDAAASRPAVGQSTAPARSRRPGRISRPARHKRAG